MSTLKFADTHNMIAFLSKPTESDGFEQIVDFLNANPIKYALTVYLTIYTSCIKQFWATVKAKTVNGEVQLQALVDGKNVIITESTIRRDLQLEDAKGVDYKAVYEEMDDSLERDATTATSLDAEQDRGNINKTQSKATLNEPSFIGTTSGSGPRRQDTMGDTIAQTRVLDLENTKTTQALEIDSLKRRVKKLEKKQRTRAHGLKRLYKVSLTAKVESSDDELSLGEDASKQGRKIHDIDADKDITLENVHDAKMFDVNDLHDEEVFVEKEVPVKEVSDVGKVNAASIATTVSAAATITTEEITLAQALMEIKTSKPKAKGIVFKEPSISTTTTTTTKPSQIKVQDKEAKRLQDEFDEEERLTREKDEANIALTKEYDDIQAKIDDDYQLAQRLQAEEQDELTDAKKARLFVQLLEKRRKYFAAKRAEEQRNKPPTKAQQKKTMITYLKNMEGWNRKDLRSKDFDSIKELFDKAFKRVNIFVDCRTKVIKESSKKAEAEVIEGSSKRAGDELEQEVPKNQKIDDDQEAAKMKEITEIVPDEEEVAIDVIPLATKPPSIMLKSFDNEDLETLWKLVKAKHGSTRPEQGYERVLCGDLKIMFEPHVEDTVLCVRFCQVVEHQVSVMKVLKLIKVARETVRMAFYACSDSLLLTPLCCDDIHDVTPRVSALAGCDRLVTNPLVIGKSPIKEEPLEEPNEEGWLEESKKEADLDLLSDARSRPGSAESGYYRHFIANSSKVAKPLAPLTQKIRKYEWVKEQEEAFQTLKDNLYDTPILSLPDGSKEFVVYCDASNQGLGCVLMQRGKVENATAEMLRGLDQLMKRKEGGVREDFKMENLARLYTNEIVTRHGVNVSNHLRLWWKIYFATLVDIAEGIENTAKTCVRLIILKRTEKKYLADTNLHVHLKEIKVDKTLRFVEEPIEIIDREVKSLKRSRIPIVKSIGTRSESYYAAICTLVWASEVVSSGFPIVKVRRDSKRGPKFTWEREDHMKAKYFPIVC
ncbi:uncharacterized mitochondrial protein-like protein [Tanacetum coccineum]